VQRDPERDPTGCRALAARRVLRRGRGRRRDEHLRRESGEPRRVRHRGPHQGTGSGRRGSGCRGGAGLVVAGSAALRPGFGGPRHETADAGARTFRGSARRVHRTGARDAGGWCRRGPHRDQSGPAAGQGGRAGQSRRHGATAHTGPDLRQRDGGDHRHHAAGLGDRSGSHSAATAWHRCDRAELRHRPDGDERTPTALEPTFRGDAHVYAERRAAGTDRRRCTLSVDARRTRRCARDVRGGLRSQPDRWVLRDHSRALAPGGGAPARAWPQGPSPERTGVGQFAVPLRAAAPGRHVPDCRGADQRQWIEGLPRGDARPELGGVRTDRPRSGARRCPRARRMHRLRRPGRGRGHGSVRLAPGDCDDPADHARLDRTRGAAGRPGAPRWAGDRELCQLRGRRWP